ncbi:MAG: 4,5-DOPA dioxygenase extradiol [Neisseria sp.]|uniref:4,5-DOPA-extradiol-dioxygenase n=1 Tax=Neisseria sp. TaxID=192066 RepID=UPI0026DC6ED6|nr:4,5-DOPA dioxygenase extradiol [Neisseria sp.]MDO4641340.1 4,5-DOPA dioxygenase extradiol [Neisseria sp.]
MSLPVLFIGHGSPINAIEDTPYSTSWQGLGEELRDIYDEEIKSILCISSNWVTDGTSVTAMDNPRTIHDFSDFPPELSKITYPAPGNPELAAEIQQLLAPDPVTADHSWGLDHATWMVLHRMFPTADIPVVQLSLNRHFNAQEHYKTAQKLAGLRKKGVLIIGSGNIIHNLSLLDLRHFNQPGPGYTWAELAHEVILKWLKNHNLTSLLDDSHYPQPIRTGQPSPEHFWPLLYVLAVSKRKEYMEIFNDEIVGKSVSMTSLIIGMD